MAPATEPEAVIVSHGSPSDPDPQEEFIRGLANRVAASAGFGVHGATLAKKGALEAAMAGLSGPVIFPHFMSDGWFVSVELPRRLRNAGLSSWRTAKPLGLAEGLTGLALVRLRDALSQNDLPAGETALIVAAHGSPSDPRPALATKAFSTALERAGLFREVRVGYVDEEPALQVAATAPGPAIVLPFFAAKAGHVLIDLPVALKSAGFRGPILEPIGIWPEISGLIATSLTCAAHGIRTPEGNAQTQLEAAHTT